MLRSSPVQSRVVRKANEHHLNFVLCYFMYCHINFGIGSLVLESESSFKMCVAPVKLGVLPKISPFSRPWRTKHNLKAYRSVKRPYKMVLGSDLGYLD